MENQSEKDKLLVQATPNSMGALAKANVIEDGLTAADKPTASDWSWQGGDVTFLEAVGRPGPLSLITLATCISFGLGTTVGVIPNVMTDIYARYTYGYDGVQSCATIIQNKPPACLLGDVAAQNGNTAANFGRCTMVFFLSALVGSFSDEYGRKGILILGMAVSCLPPMMLVSIQLFPDTINPAWFFSMVTLTGIVDWNAVCLSSLSDVMPPAWRAPAYGLFFAGASAGGAVAPFLATIVSNLEVAVAALIIQIVAVCLACFLIPETLPRETSIHARQVRRDQTEGKSTLGVVLWNLKRPLWELSILNRYPLFQLLASLALFSGMATSGDNVLVFFYLENQLGFSYSGVASVLLFFAVWCMITQTIGIKAFNELFGEKYIIMIAFFLGFLHNLCFGFARGPFWIYVGFFFSAFLWMAFPAISSIKSMNVDESEQGRVQGALWSVQSLSAALGPVLMESIFIWTQKGALFGPGSMFVLSSGLYLLGFFVSFNIPYEVTSKGKRFKVDTVPDAVE